MIMDLTEAIKMYLAGVPVTEIARKFGKSKQAMWNALKRRGVIRPRNKVTND